MANADSRTAVLAAVVGNGVLTIVKLAAFLASRSPAMLSETIHSFADTANQVLLFIGIRKSERPEDALFHYGYGADRYLYSLLSAVGIFVLGCGVTVYHGVHSLLNPPELKLSWITFAVLGLALVIDGFVLFLAVRTTIKQKGDKPFFRFLRETSDPTVTAVLLEDAVACLGVIVAAAGIWLAHVTGNPMFDAAGAIIIGLMLGGVAVWLGIKNRTLLLGPSISREVHDQMESFLAAQPSIERVFLTRSRIVGANKFRFQAQLDFDGGWLARQHMEVIERHAAQLADPLAADAFAEEFGELILRTLADEVDRIEAELRERFPRLRYADLEVD